MDNAQLIKELRSAITDVYETGYCYHIMIDNGIDEDLAVKIQEKLIEKSMEVSSKLEDHVLEMLDELREKIDNENPFDEIAEVVEKIKGRLEGYMCKCERESSK